VLEKNPNTVKVVFKNFPLRSHKYAVPAAIAALAAGRQGKFWEFHDELFKVYKKINDKKINEIAQNLALNMPEFQENIKDPAIMRLVRDDMQEGMRIGIRGVPSVYINGKKFKGRQPQNFQAAIDKELNKAGGN
jgi:protein-disulfide isomerase